MGNFENLTPACNFPWLISNAWDRESGEPLGQCHRSVVIERNGWRVGVIGLIEYEWLETLSTVPVKQVRWVDYVVVARELAQHLRATEHVDLVVALTHMRIPNDERLAAEVPEVDLVLGGHDHDYYVNKVRRTWVIKSGTDFRDLSRITIPGGQKLAYDASTQWASREPLALDVDHLTVTRELAPDPEAQRVVAFHLDRLSSRMGKVAGLPPPPAPLPVARPSGTPHRGAVCGISALIAVGVAVDRPVAAALSQVLCSMAQPLDARFSQIRTVETNVSNWVILP